VSCFFIFPRPTTLEVSGYFVLSMWLAADIAAAAAGVQTVNFFVHVLGFGAGAGLAVWALKKQWVKIGRGEKTLLQVFGKEVPIVEEEREDEEEEEAIEKRQAEETRVVTMEEAGPKAAAAKQVRPAGGEGLIVFYCECGQKFKVPRQLSGKAGRCPRCKRAVKIP
jgi:hypothetical protein